MRFSKSFGFASADLFYRITEKDYRDVRRKFLKCAPSANHVTSRTRESPYIRDKIFFDPLRMDIISAEI